MRLSKNAIGNFIARYTAVLKKCAVINLMAAGLLLGGVMGGIAKADTTISTADGLADFLTKGKDATGTMSNDILNIDWGDNGKETGGSAITKSLYFNGKEVRGTGVGISVLGLYILHVYGGTASTPTSSTGTIYEFSITSGGTGKVYISDMNFFRTGGGGVVSGSNVDISKSAFTVSGNTGYGVNILSYIGGTATTTATGRITDASFDVSGEYSAGVAVHSEAGTATANITNASFDVSGSYTAGVDVNSYIDTATATATAIISDASFDVSGRDSAGVNVRFETRDARGMATATASITNASFNVSDSNAYGVNLSFETGGKVTATANISKSSFTGAGTGIYNNAATVNFSDNNTVNSIVSSGTVNINSDSILTMTKSWDGISGTTGTLTNNGTLDIATPTGGTTEYSSLNVGTLNGSGNLTIDVKITDNTGSNDKLILSGIGDDVSINLSKINVVDSRTVMKTATLSNYITYIEVEDGKEVDLTKIDYSLDNKTGTEAKLSVPMGHFVYTFTFGDEPGKLSLVVEPGGPSLPEFIQGKECTDSTFSMPNAMTLTESLGTTNRNKGQKELTLAFNGNTLTGAEGVSNNGVTVADGYTLNLSSKSASGKMTGFTTAATVNSGAVLNVKNVIFEDNGKDIDNKGIVNFSGTNSLTSLTGTGSATNTGTLNISADGLGNAIENSGTLKLDKGTLAKAISGNGSITLMGNVSSNADYIGNPVTTNEHTLTLTGGTLTKAISGTGFVSNSGNLSIADGVSFKNFTGIYTQTAGSTSFKNAEFGGDVSLKAGKFTAENLSVASDKKFTVDSATANLSGTLTNKGNISIGETGSLTASTVSLAGGNIDVAGSFGSVDTALSFEGGTLTLKDKALVYAKDSKILASSGYLTTEGAIATDLAKTGINATSSDTTLCLWLTQADTSYTTAYLVAAKNALFDGDTEKAGLVFINGKLKLDKSLGEKTVAKVSVETTADNKTKAVFSGTQETEGGVAPGTKVAGSSEAYAVLKNGNTIMNAPDSLIIDGLFMAKGIEVADVTVPRVTIEAAANSVITLIGAETKDKSVIAKNGAPTLTPTDFKVASGATLNFGISDNTNLQKASVSDVAINNGIHNVAGNGIDKTDFSYESLEVQGEEAKVNINNAKISVKTASLEGATFNVLNAFTKIEKLTATNGSIYIDPAYLEVSDLSGDSFGANLLVGDGSVVNMGMDLSKINEAAQKAGFNSTAMGEGFALSEGESMLAVNGNVNLGDTGKVIVDANVDASGKVNGADISDTVHFGENSLLVVNGNEVTEKAAISSTKAGASAKIADTAKLFIGNAQAGQKYSILDLTGEISGAAGWNGDNLLSDSDMLNATFHYDGDDKGKVTMDPQSSTESYPRLDGELARLVNNLYKNGLNDVDSSMPGIKFLSRATNKRFLGLDKDAATQAIESASRIAMAGAAPQMSIMASESLSDAIGNRMNISNGYNPVLEQAFQSGLTLWITPLWKNQSGFGMEACKLDYGFNANIGGIALGADYSFNENIKAGLAFNIGGGYAKSSGDLSSTENHMNFWGLGLYGGYNDGIMSVMADVSYTSTYNKLEQDLDSRMQMRNLKADVRAAVWSAGIRGDYKVKLDALDITPHLGLRYTNISSQEYDIKGGGTIAKSDGFQQSFWSIPVGVTFGKDFKTASGWSVTPSVDFTVTPRFGDLKAYETVRFTGESGDAGLHTQTRDYVTYKGTASIGAKYNNIGLNLNYSYEAGSRTSGHGVNASFKYEF